MDCSGFSWAALTRSKTLAMVMAEAAADPLAEGHGFASTPAPASTTNQELGSALLAATSPTKAKKALRKTLTVWDLIGYGVGSTVGAGIYSLIGPGVKQAGPALLLSFVLGAISCVFTALCYSEFASRIPVAGSAYTYAYTSFGELLGWFIGWNLTLEYAISSAAVARAWGSYLSQLLSSIHADPPEWLHKWDCGNGIVGSPLAALCVFLLSAAMLPGVKESTRLNSVVTVTNVCVLAFITFLGASKVDTANWTVVHDSFAPYGVSSVFTAAGTVFFSYLGFDMVSSMAEEVKKPKRDMPIGIIGSLTIAGIIYVAVTLVVTGMVPFTEIMDADAPLSHAFKLTDLNWATYIINVGSVFGLTSACFTGLMGQPRIFYRMAHDGLLFPLFGRLSKNGVPLMGTLITAIITAAIAFTFTLGALADAISIGTLAAFSCVDAGIVVLRRRDAHSSMRSVLGVVAFTLFSFFAFLSMHMGWSLITAIVLGVLALGCLVFLYTLPVVEASGASFETPWVPLVPCIGIALNMSMMSGLGWAAWARLGVWTVIGFVIYFGYGIHNSVLGHKYVRVASKDATAMPVNAQPAEADVECSPSKGTGAGFHTE